MTLPIDITKHIGLVQSQARTFKLYSGSTTYEDLVQAGCIGLMEAAKRYDPERGAFSTYAVPWIRKYMTLELQENRRLIRVPRNASNKAKVEGQQYRDYADELTDDMLSVDCSEMEQELEDKQLYEKTQQVINTCLDTRARQIIHLRFRKGYGIVKTAQIMSISRNLVKQIENESLAVLKEELKKVTD